MRAGEILRTAHGRRFSLSEAYTTQRWALSASAPPLMLTLPNPQELLERASKLLVLEPSPDTYAATSGRSALRRAPRAPWDLVLLPCSISINLGGLEASVGAPPDDLNLQLLPSHLRVEQDSDGVTLITDSILLRCVSRLARPSHPYLTPDLTPHLMSYLLPHHSSRPSPAHAHLALAQNNLRGAAARWAQLTPLVGHLLAVIKQPRGPPTLRPEVSRARPHHAAGRPPLVSPTASHLVAR